MSNQTPSAASISTVAERAAQMCVPLFWPLAVGAEIAEAELKLTVRNIKFLAEAQKIDYGLHPQFATENHHFSTPNRSSRSECSRK
jgi:poly(3-hydroxybutyrate) depolymerase